MAKGVVDVYVSKELKENTIVLIVNCGGGLANDLHLIRDGSQVTLQRGETRHEVEVTQENGNECSFNYMEVDPHTASILGMRDKDRFALEFSPEAEQTIKLRRLTVQQASGRLIQETRKNRDGSIVIGYLLLSWLGIEDKQNTVITLVKENIQKKLRVSIPPNELDADFRLSAANLRLFGLTPGKVLNLQYNRATHTLSVLTRTPAVAASVRRTKRPVQPGKTVKKAGSAVKKTAKPSARRAQTGRKPSKPQIR